MSGFCPVDWVPCQEGCEAGECRHATAGPTLDDFEAWRDAMEQELLLTLLHPLPPLPRRASTEAEVEGGTLPT